MISIVIPVFNGEKYLAECILSCIDQTYQDYEIIIVNDGSTDGTEKIINRFQSNYNKIRSVYKANGGTASALNKGIKNMGGSWFKWLSADDKFNSKSELANMMKLISTIPVHEQYIFYTDYNIINVDSKIIKEFLEPDRTELVRDLRNVILLHYFYGNASTSLIHKKLIEKVGFFKENLNYGEDYEYWLRACIKYKFTLYHLPLRTIQYRVHPDSLTTNKDFIQDAKYVKELTNQYFCYLSDNQIQYLKELKNNQIWRRKYIPLSVRAKALSFIRRIK